MKIFWCSSDRHGEAERNVLWHSEISNSYFIITNSTIFVCLPIACNGPVPRWLKGVLFMLASFGSSHYIHFYVSAPLAPLLLSVSLLIASNQFLPSFAIRVFRVSSSNNSLHHRRRHRLGKKIREWERERVRERGELALPHLNEEKVEKLLLLLLHICQLLSVSVEFFIHFHVDRDRASVLVCLSKTSSFEHSRSCSGLRCSG